MTEPIRILHVTGLAHAGSGQHVLTLASGCDPRRYSATVAMAARSSMRPRFEKAGVPVVPLSIDHYGGVGKNCRALVQLMRLMRRGHFDIVHTHTSVAGALGRLAARCCTKAKTVHMLHAFVSHDRQRPLARSLGLIAERALDRLTDAYISGSQAMIERGVEKRIFSAAKATKIYYGVDLPELDAQARFARQSSALSPDRRDSAIVVGFLGRLEEQKGAEFLLRAARIVQSKNENIRFLIAGDGTLRQALERLADDLNLSQIVEFVGWQEDVAAVLQRIDIFAMPSLWEAFGLSAAEAMALQKPVIASKVEGLQEVVAEGVTGLLIPPGEPEALSAAILKLAHDQPRRRAFGLAGRARIERNFTATDMIESHEQFYEQLFASQNCQPAAEEVDLTGAAAQNEFISPVVGGHPCKESLEFP